MGNFNILAVVVVAALGVSACSSAQNDAFLGSRDDIIISNSGVSEKSAKADIKSKIETAKKDAASIVVSEEQEVGVVPSETAVVSDGADKARTAVAEVSGTAQTTMPETTTTLVATPAPVAPSNMAGDIPPNAKPGECYAKVLIPAVMQNKSGKIQVSEEQKVLNRIIPATYRIETERVQVSEEKKVLNRIIPAQYRTETERVLVKPARQYWKAGHGPVTKKNEVTGEIMCLVEEPAEYKTVEKRILVAPEKPEYKIIPAQFETIERRVLVEPEKPEYKMVPAQFETVTTTEVVRGESWEWRRILCETNMGENSVTRIQQALRSKGYNLVIDGRLGNETMQALNDYQRKNGLATRGITYETLDSLGVQLIGA